MRRVGKRLAAAREQVDKDTLYTLEDAVRLAKSSSYTNFDGSIDLSFKLNLDTKKADQQLRGSVTLPHGNGKNTIVLVASEDAGVRESATKAGADIVLDRGGLEEKLSQDAKYDFDVIVVEPRMMAILGKYGKKLGPKGLMPNPKNGTVTTNVPVTVANLKKGKALYRADRGGCVHTSIGRVSMSEDSLSENARTVISSIKRSKPAGVKGVYIQKIYLSASMGPGIRVRLEQ